MEQPRYYWDPNIASSGMIFYTDELFPAWQNSLSRPTTPRAGSLSSFPSR